jgi:hypothetical protein
MKKLTLKKIILTFAMMVLVMGTFVACGSNAGENTEKESELQLVPEEELEGKKFKRGDVFADMTVTTPEGKTYKISEILKRAKDTNSLHITFWP